MGYETDSIRNKNLALTTELGQVRAECQALRNDMAMMKQSMARVRSESAADIRKARQQRKTRVVVREVKVPGPVRIVEKMVEKRVPGPVRIVEKIVPGPVRTVTVPGEEKKAEAVKWKRLHDKLKIQVEDLVRRLNVGN